MKVSNDDHDTVISRLPGLTYVQMSREAPVNGMILPVGLDSEKKTILCNQEVHFATQSVYCYTSF